VKCWLCLGLVLSALVACKEDDDPSPNPIGRADAGTDAGTDAGRPPPTRAEPCMPDDSAPPLERDEYGTWQKVELPGTFCSNGSQYKFFVNYSETRNDLIVIFEPGGACWDFESCSGGGLRGAANPDGIPDDHMDTWQHAHPAAGGAFGMDGEFADWNKVFIPYCTGDVHSGSRTVTYSSADGSESIEYRHVGHQNMLVVSDWLAETFTSTPRMMVTGCSAGGAGALLNYPLLRQRMQGVQCGYLLDDSGPIFPSDGPSAPLHAMIRSSWDTDATLDDYTAIFGEDGVEAVRDDFGAFNSQLADAFPHDRLAVTLFRRDLNYSLYSYDSFYDSPPYDTIVEYWEQDIAALRALYDSRPNLAYYIPYFRRNNCSHCSTIIPNDYVDELLAGTMSPWEGTDIAESDMTMPEFIGMLVDDGAELTSYYEQSMDDGELDADAIAECRQ
jgi:hypothetical protein